MQLFCAQWLNRVLFRVETLGDKRHIVLDGVSVPIPLQFAEGGVGEDFPNVVKCKKIACILYGLCQIILAFDLIIISSLRNVQALCRRGQKQPQTVLPVFLGSLCQKLVFCCSLKMLC